LDDRTRTRLDEYVSDVFVREDEALRWIQAEAERAGLPSISVEPFEGRVLQFLVQLSRTKTIVEIGTLAGYSAVWMARALPPGGRLITLEKSSKHAAVARAGFERAGLADRVELLEGDARESLAKLTPRGPFDMVFIDADKGSYPAYLAWTIDNLRPGGLVAAHNAFRSGRILTPDGDEDRLIDTFNRSLAAEPRLDAMILAIGDGFAVGVKKG
jgi:caffeoyl-CoA O-methyltransferase